MLCYIEIIMNEEIMNSCTGKSRFVDVVAQGSNTSIFSDARCFVCSYSHILTQAGTYCTSEKHVIISYFLRFRIYSKQEIKCYGEVNGANNITWLEYSSSLTSFINSMFSVDFELYRKY